MCTVGWLGSCTPLLILEHRALLIWITTDYQDREKEEHMTHTWALKLPHGSSTIFPLTFHWPKHITWPQQTSKGAQDYNPTMCLKDGILWTTLMNTTETRGKQRDRLGKRWEQLRLGGHRGGVGKQMQRTSWRQRQQDLRMEWMYFGTNWRINLAQCNTHCKPQ